MFPRCPQCQEVSPRWSHRVLPSLFTTCPACGAKLKPTILSGPILDAVLIIPACWAMFIAQRSFGVALLLLLAAHALAAPLRRFTTR